MKIKLTYNKETDNNILGFEEVTEIFQVKEVINGSYLLINNWFVDFKYSVDGDWEIYNNENYISICSKPVLIKH